MRHRGATVLAAALLAAAATSACSSGPEAEPSDERPATSAPSIAYEPGDPCPVTTPMSASELPSALADSEGAWYGSGPLWVDLGNFDAPVASAEGGLRVKHAWWTGDDAGATDAMGPPQLTARSLTTGEDAQASTNGYAESSDGDSIVAWWPSALDVPGPGCWELTGSLDSTTVTVVVEIPEAG